ncbi:MAG: hypothetical protein K2X63_06885 [Burkholderiaceae bacterium]|nr:hypothetical protein [Burkholderiaceae bacterium]
MNMNLEMLHIENIKRQLLRGFTYFALSMTLAACGGGGGSPGTVTGGSNTSTTPNGKIQLTLIDSKNQPANLVTSANPLVANVIVTNDKGAVVPGVVVTFSLDSAIATLQPTSGTALTDAKGVAQVSLTAGTGAGAGTITASALIVGTTTVSAKASFSVGSSPAAPPAAINFVSATPTNKSIVIKGAGGNGRTEIALLSFMVVDSSNAGIANRKVNFSTQSSQPVSLVSSSGVTDSTGKVSAAISSGTAPTTVRVVATVDGTSISVISDTVTVTTGLPTQTAFTLAREKVNVEGINNSNVLNTITALLADANGGVVANGTPVVFTTDSGAIIGDQGTNDTARCLTGPPNAPGSCSVVWRSQAPSKSIVTVVATTTNGTETLTATVQFSNSTSKLIVTGFPSSLAFSCATLPLASIEALITITDENGLSAPDGTTLTVLNTVNGSMTVTPDKVNAPADPAAAGTNHKVTFIPATTCTAGAKGQATLQLKTPLGAPQMFTVVYNYN